MTKETLKYMGLDLNQYYEGLLIKNADTSYHVRPKDGQAKLIMTEIELMSMMEAAKFRCKYFVVCGGAAGIHYALLAKMYPHVKFILFDKRPFYTPLRSISNVKCISEYVTVDTFEKLRLDPSCSVFVSDMRSLEIAKFKSTPAVYNTIIMRDMYEQLMLFALSKYQWGMLKFKLPETISIPYPKGKLLIQPFINSNELRLVISADISAIHMYDGAQIESVCQIVNNYWKQTNSLSVSSRVAEELSRYNLPKRWDFAAMMDILIRADKLSFVSEIIKLIRKQSSS